MNSIKSVRVALMLCEQISKVVSLRHCHPTKNGNSFIKIEPVFHLYII